MSDPGVALGEILDHLEEIRRRDLSNYLAILERFHHQIEKAFATRKTD